MLFWVFPHHHHHVPHNISTCYQLYLPRRLEACAHTYRYQQRLNHHHKLTSNNIGRLPTYLEINERYAEYHSSARLYAHTKAYSSHDIRRMNRTAERWASPIWFDDPSQPRGSTNSQNIRAKAYGFIFFVRQLGIACESRDSAKAPLRCAACRDIFDEL